MPCSRDEHRVSGRIRQRYRLAAPVGHADARGPFRQYRAHPPVRLDRGDAPAPGEPASAGPAQRGFGLLVPPRSQASGVSDLPGDYRSLVEAVTAVAAETGGAVTCMQAAARAGLDVSGRQSENVRARLKRLEDRGWLRRTAAGKFTIAP